MCTHPHAYFIRYRPEIAAARKGFATVTPDGVAIDIAVSLDGGAKFAVELVPHSQLSTANTVSLLRRGSGMHES